MVLYGSVYDVTEFLPSHPGGSKIILQLAGRDATEEYDPIHPPGLLEENLKPEANLGTVDPDSMAKLEEERQAKALAKKSSSDPVPAAAPATAPDAASAAAAAAAALAAQPLHMLLNLDEIESVAKAKVSKKCWAYYFSAGDDLFSKYYNNTVFRSILLRPRVFVDCTTASTATTLLGHGVGTPLYVSPAAMARLAHPDGEAGIARGISGFGGMQLVSNNASMTPEQIVAEAPAGQVFGWQLYVQTDRRKSEAMLRRINALRDHFKFIVLTLDAPVPGKREMDEKSNLESQEVVESASNDKGDAEKRPGGGGVGQQLFWGTAADLTWNTTLSWLASHTDLPVVLKGVQTHEDTYLAAQYARQHPGKLKAVILSNHGGRALDTAPPAMHTLLEIRKYCPEAFNDIEVWIDGGIRRGTDVVKALCLGAKAVGVGRAALFGLGAGGWRGVERTYESKLLHARF